MSDWPEDFEAQFWAAYPRRVAKIAAFKALGKVRKTRSVPWEILIAGVRSYAEWAKSKNMEYIKHPTTWLNGGCWDDELTKPVVEVKPPGFYAAFDSEQLTAWEDFERRTGHKWPRDKRGGWYFPCEWPTGWN